MSEPSSPASLISTTADPGAEAVAELLGMLAYGELLAFERMASDARLAPDLDRRAVLSEMAAAEITNYQRLAARLAELGAEPQQVMTPYVQPLQAYHNRTEPRDWLEALTKAYVGDSVADDFFREVAAFLADRDRQLVLEVLHDSRYGEFAADEIRTAIAADPKLANRLSIWARRLMGEGLSQAQHVAAARPTLATLIITGAGDQDGVTALLRRLTSAHGARMNAVGLNN
ncbi:hydroxylase [Natronosporangium hydrolyticum]|uniref:Hydroxylase n=1 Tax=Natronosporangium hydrolyticum TaxID=2811111 RepID=A0A895YKT9_9ACTN|nr:ferritin-like fold-containing protein [Natronosporangium hydrolyticum]QSB14468.1 hydroxylase [Natronosporangium hydrolyticum]